MIINGPWLLSSGAIKNSVGTKIKENGVSYGLSEAGYDIRIKQDVCFYPAAYHHWDGRMIRPSSYWVGMGNVEHVGNFCLASTIEEFDMPNDLVGIVHDKSTWARQGLSVFNTVIEPGWSGFLTLELVYHGNEPLHIPAGSGIAQVIFHQTSHPAAYTGKYQHQSDEPVNSIFE